MPEALIQIPVGKLAGPMQTTEAQDALLITNRLIQGVGGNNEARFTPMQLIKMVYIAHGWMLGLLGRPLIEQPVEAWKYGPVVADVYFAIKHYRDRPVDAPVGGVLNDGIGSFESALIEKVRDVYGRFDGITLSAITHEPGTPWHRVVHDKKRVGRHVEIPNSLIENYYKKRIKSK